MDIAISAISRIRECGTASADAATTGLNLVSGLDTLEDRRCWNAEAGKNGGIGEPLIDLESQRRGCAHVLIVPSTVSLAADSAGGGQLFDLQQLGRIVPGVAGVAVFVLSIGHRFAKRLQRKIGQRVRF